MDENCPVDDSPPEWESELFFATSGRLFSPPRTFPTGYILSFYFSTRDPPLRPGRFNLLGIAPFSQAVLLMEDAHLPFSFEFPFLTPLRLLLTPPLSLSALLRRGRLTAFWTAKLEFSLIGRNVTLLSLLSQAVFLPPCLQAGSLLAP